MFLLILLKKVLKQETIALDVKAEVSMKCENIDTDEPLTHLNQTICPSQNQSGELIEQNDPRDFFFFPFCECQSKLFGPCKWGC